MSLNFKKCDFYIPENKKKRMGARGKGEKCFSGLYLCLPLIFLVRSTLSHSDLLKPLILAPSTTVLETSNSMPNVGLLAQKHPTPAFPQTMVSQVLHTSVLPRRLLPTCPRCPAWQSFSTFSSPKILSLQNLSLPLKVRQVTAWKFVKITLCWKWELYSPWPLAALQVQSAPVSCSPPHWHPPDLQWGLNSFQSLPW